MEQVLVRLHQIVVLVLGLDNTDLTSGLLNLLLDLQDLRFSLWCWVSFVSFLLTTKRAIQFPELSLSSTKLLIITLLDNRD